MMIDLPYDLILERTTIQKFIESTSKNKVQSWSNVIDDDDFHDQTCRKAFAAIRVCVNRGKNPDISSLFATGYITHDELETITLSKPVSSSMTQNIGLLKEYSIKREIIKKSEEIKGKMLNSSNPREDALQFIDSLTSISKSKSAGDLLDTKKLVKETLQMLKDGASSDSKLRVFFHADFMDKYVLAFRKEVVVIAGDSAMGKTSLALSCILPQILAGEHVVYFCSESDNTKLMAKLWAQYIECSFTDLLLHVDRLTDEQLTKLKYISDKISEHSNNFHLYGAGTYEPSVSGITTKAQEIAEQYGQIDMLYVDYLQDMNAPSFYVSDEVKAISYNIKGIKTLTQTLNCACVVLAQINREARNNIRPVMQNLKGSSKIENVASIILFLHREKDQCKHEDVIPTLLYSDKTRDQKPVWTTIGFRANCTRYEKYTNPIKPKYNKEYDAPKLGTVNG